MKDKTFGVPIKDFVWLTFNIYTLIKNTIINLEKQKALIKMLLIMNWYMEITRISCLMDYIWDIKWKQFKANTVMQDCMELIKYLYLLTMTKKIMLKYGYTRSSHF